MDLKRYHRQTLVPEIGSKGQLLLQDKTVLIIGGGGLGSSSSEILTRMGIGKIIVVDYDFVDESNLHRTSLFSEKDIDAPKASTLKKKLQNINSKTSIQAHNKRVTKENIETFITTIDLIIDATDNIDTRFLINTISLKKNIPWVYAGVYSTVGMVMGILPKQTPCFNCLSNAVTPQNTQIPVLGNLPMIAAGIQCTEAIKILLGKPLSGLIIYDIWKQNFDHLMIKKNPKCKSCGKNSD
ncbi:MAG: HesA/MoeB/ThiF family protein [Thermoplasmatota archaeon]